MQLALFQARVQFRDFWPVRLRGWRKYLHVGLLRAQPLYFLELELELIQFHMAQKPMLRGEVGARVRVIRACDQDERGGMGGRGGARRPDEWVLM